jgi:hypothetical protein
MINATERCVDPVPKDAVPAPAGTYLSQWRGAMSYHAQQQHWVIPRNEWFDGGSQLGPQGQRHLDRVVQCLAEAPRTVVIENEPLALELGDDYEEAVKKNRQLQFERRNTVVTALAEAGIENADQWVVFAEDRNVGVRGIEAPQIYNRQFIGGFGRGNRGGAGRGQGGFGQGGFGQGGFGGGFGQGGFGGGGFGGFGGGGIF